MKTSRRGFGAEMSKEEVIEHMNAGDTLHLIYHGRRLAGFAAYTHMGMEVQSGAVAKIESVLYLHGVVLDMKYQGKKLFALSAEIEISKGRPYAFTLRTQNPAMYSALMSVVFRTHPGSMIHPSHEDAPDEMAQAIASHIAKMLGERHFNLSSFTDVGTYGRALNGSVPRVNPEVEGLFSRLEIDRRRGDSIIVVALLRE